MVDLGNPFEKKDPIQDKRRNYRYRTAFYSLLEVEDRASLQNDFNQFVNDNNKYGLVEFTIGSKIDGTPYVIARFRDDIDLEARNLNWFDIHVQMFAHYQFAQMDEIINRHDNRTLRLLAEKRFVYKTGEICSFLIWAEIRSTARSQEALDALRTVFARA